MIRYERYECSQKLLTSAAVIDKIAKSCSRSVSLTGVPPKTNTFRCLGYMFMYFIFCGGILLFSGHFFRNLFFYRFSLTAFLFPLVPRNQTNGRNVSHFGFYCSCRIPSTTYWLSLNSIIISGVSWSGICLRFRSPSQTESPQKPENLFLEDTTAS